MTAVHWPTFPTGITVDEGCGRHRIYLQGGNICRFAGGDVTNTTHIHHCWECCLVLSGSGAVAYGDERLALRAGDVTVADPGIVHEISSCGTEDLVLYFFLFDARDTKAPLSAGLADGAIDAFLRGHRRLSHGHGHLAEYLRFADGRRRAGDVAWVRELFRLFCLECLDALCREHAQPPTPDHGGTLLDRAIGVIDRHRRLAIAEVAAQCGTSVRNLQHLFRSHLGTTATAFTNGRRAHHAAALLVQGRSAADAAKAIGIDDPAQFSRLFKRHYGLGPRDFQRRHAPRGMRLASQPVPPDPDGREA